MLVDLCGHDSGLCPNHIRLLKYFCNDNLRNVYEFSVRLPKRVEFIRTNGPGDISTKEHLSLNIGYPNLFVMLEQAFQLAMTFAFPTNGIPISGCTTVTSFDDAQIRSISSRLWLRNAL